MTLERLSMPRITTSKEAPLSEQLLRRICNEFIEMPGLRLTREQAQRLWGLDAPTCDASLNYLVESKFLTELEGSRYARLTDGPLAGLPPFRLARVYASSR